MKYTVNQLAISSYWLVAGKDGKIDGEEYAGGWEMLKHNENFEQSLDDWGMIKGLYMTKHLEWDEIAACVAELPLLSRYHIIRYVVQCLNKTRGKEDRSVDSWPALQTFSHDVGIYLKAYNVWSQSH